MTHRHYDLTAIEAQLREQAAEANEVGKQMVDLGEASATLLQAQREFDEARIQFVLAGMRCENAGLDRKDQLAGAGFAIGQVWGNVLSGCVGAHDRAVVNGWLQQALASTIGIAATAKTIDTVLKPMEAGHA